MKNPDSELKEILKKVKDIISTEKNSGVEEFPSIRKFLGAVTSSNNEKESLMNDLKVKALSCKNCVLHKSRRNVVFGVGNLNTKLMFVGEAPGADEDREGLPFVGRAGELLTKIIESIGFKRTEIYIGNILKCRPPENRFPDPGEVSKCIHIIRKQIEIIRPDLICTLGKCATQSLLNSDQPISRLRGNFQDYNGIKVMPTYHPAYLLRSPSEKRVVWEDMKKIKRELSLKS